MGRRDWRWKIAWRISRAALKHGADIIELDVQATADGKLVVLHDPTTGRVAKSKVTIRQKTLKQLGELQLLNGESLLSLDEALEVIGKTPVIIDLRATKTADELVAVLRRHPQTNPIILSFFPEELRRVRQLLPDITIYLAEHFAPIAIVRNAARFHATGIALNKWLMNPLTYRLANHHRLRLAVYNVDSPAIARFMLRLYPGVDLYTNHPERFTKAIWRTQNVPTKTAKTAR